MSVLSFAFELQALLENPSLAALVGAFSAYSLVVLTDYRRKRQKKNALYGLISLNRELLLKKLDAVERVLQAFSATGTLRGGPIQKFSTEDIRRLKTEVLDLLGHDELLALETLCYHMEAVDDLLEAGSRKTDRLRESPSKEATEELVTSILVDYRDAEVNMARLRKFMVFFESKQFDKIFRHELGLNSKMTITIRDASD